MYRATLWDRLLTGFKTTWLRQGHWVRQKEKPLSTGEAFGECYQIDLKKAVQYQQSQPDKCCPGLQCLCPWINQQNQEYRCSE